MYPSGVTIALLNRKNKMVDNISIISINLHSSPRLMVWWQRWRLSRPWSSRLPHPGRVIYSYNLYFPPPNLSRFIFVISHFLPFKGTLFRNFISKILATLTYFGKHLSRNNLPIYIGHIFRKRLMSYVLNFQRILSQMRKKKRKKV